MTNRRNFIKKSFTGMVGIAVGKRGFLSGENVNEDQNLAKYTILTTCPPYGSQNIGDKLIEQRTKDLISSIKGNTEFLTIFREEELEPYLEQINRTRAVIMPGFPVRDTPMYPGVYRLLNDISRIRVPMIPVGANWNTYPGDEQSRNEISYSEETKKFLTYIADKIDILSCREYFTCEVLEKHNIKNTLMTGDPAWFLLSSLGKPMHRPTKVRRLVFSPPLSPYYLEQAKLVMEMLAKIFPDADRTCAFHLFDADSNPAAGSKQEKSAALSPEVTSKNRAIREYAGKMGYQVREMAGDLNNLEYYQICDLHVGYECHAHLNFFSRRIPSVLIAEDARGIGFNYTLGIGGFTGFTRTQVRASSVRKSVTSGYCTSIEELVLAPPKTSLHLEIEKFLFHELESGFRRYLGLADYLDDVFENRMHPFIKSLP